MIKLDYSEISTPKTLYPTTKLLVHYGSFCSFEDNKEIEPI